MRCLVTHFALLAAMSAAGAAARERPVANMRDMQAHFARCFQPPSGPNASQVTIHFALKENGEVYGRLRIAWLKFKGSNKSRKILIDEFRAAFERCLPVPLSEELAHMVPGKIYFLSSTIRVPGTKPGGVTLHPHIVSRPLNS